MLFGEHAVVYNHPCLVTAVDQRIKATVSLLDQEEFQLEAPDVKVSNYIKKISQIGKGDILKGAQFVEIAVKNFYYKYNLKKGIRIETSSEFSSEFGFGSSSASTVCVIKALSQIFGLSLSNKEIFDLSYKTVLDIQEKGSGFDVAAAVYGGTIYFLTGGEKIEPLNISNLPPDQQLNPPSVPIHTSPVTALISIETTPLCGNPSLVVYVFHFPFS